MTMPTQERPGIVWHSYQDAEFDKFDAIYKNLSRKGASHYSLFTYKRIKSQCQLIGC